MVGVMGMGVGAARGGGGWGAAAATRRTDGRRLVYGREMSGGKGAKGGNLESLGNTGPADDVATRRKPAETGGNWRALHWRGPSGGAGTAENKLYVPTASSRAPPGGCCPRHQPPGPEDNSCLR